MDTSNIIDVLMTAGLATVVVTGLIFAGMASAIVTGAAIGSTYVLVK